LVVEPPKYPHLPSLPQEIPKDPILEIEQSQGFSIMITGLKKVKDRITDKEDIFTKS
jgi:hypothetical protein